MAVYERRHLWATLGVLLLLLPLPPAAARTREAVPLDRLASGGAASVAEVIDGDTVVLADGRQVRLVGMQAPKLPLGRSNFPTWPLAPEAKAKLQALAGGRAVTLLFGGRRIDRHGRTLAHLRRDDGLWLQGAMLQAGFARVYSFADNRALVAEMLALESEARAGRRGIWSHPYYAIRRHDALVGDSDTFQLVEGRVRAVGQAGGRVFLNFGADWKTDFTLRLEASDRELFERAGFDYRLLEGANVRARGWVEWRNGPEIHLTHPEEIERLDGPDWTRR